MSATFKIKALLLTASTLGGVFGVVPAFAQTETPAPAPEPVGDDTDSIIVTGTRRATSLSDVPINIIAVGSAQLDTQRIYDIRGLADFTPGVTINQTGPRATGTVVLRGAQLDVRQDAEGYQFGTVTAAAGKRAFFRQKRDTLPGQPDEYVEGEAEVIEYDGKADNVKLIRRGELRRYRGTALSDEITGAVIVYNNLTDVFTVDGQARAPGSTGGTSGGRVRAVLAPKEQPPAAPAAPAANLRPSMTIEPKK